MTSRISRRKIFSAIAAAPAALAVPAAKPKMEGTEADPYEDWVNVTPKYEPAPDRFGVFDGTAFQLNCWSPDGSGQQIVDLTRDEFIALKRHLAVARGLIG